MLTSTQNSLSKYLLRVLNQNWTISDHIGLRITKGDNKIYPREGIIECECQNQKYNGMKDNNFSCPEHINSCHNGIAEILPFEKLPQFRKHPY